MKKILIPFLFFVGITAFIACQKENSSDPNQVQAVKTEGIKKGEPVLFSVDNQSGQAAQWAVTPATNALLTPNGNNATIFFRKAGSYLVTANMGNATARITINVIDSIYCDSLGHCDTTIIDTCRYGNCDSTIIDTCRYGGCHRDSIYSLAGDQIHITPEKIDSSAISGLRIIATTQNNYPCASAYLMTNVTNSGANFALEYNGVFIPWNCTGQAHAQSTQVFFPIQDGSHGFTIKVNGINYTGSFTKSGNQFSFNWPYTSGVTITPQNL